MIKDPSGLLIGHYTPTSAILAEVTHLSNSFDHKFKDDVNSKDSSIKLMAKQIIDTVTVQSALGHSQKEILNFTNNGIYAAKKGIYTDVVQIDTHSQLPTFMYYLGLMDKKHEQLFLRKKEIENMPDYKSDPKLIEEREAIKLELNIYCSTNDTGKGRYVNRLAAMYSGMNFIFDSMHYWGLSNVLNCVNDGYILQIKDDGDFNKQYQDFKQQWQSEFPLLTFSKKHWKYAIINGTQDYILINNSNDYKCRSSQLSTKAFYHQATGKSLDKLKQSEIDNDAFKYAQEKEKVAMMVLYNNLFNNQEPDLYGSNEKLEDLNETKEILIKAGVVNASFLPEKQHYYSFTPDLENSDQDNDYINQLTKRVLDGQIFMSTELLRNRINLLKQLIKVKEVNPDDYANTNHVVMVNSFVPSIVDEIEKNQSIKNWVKYEVEKIEKSDEDKLYQYNLLALTAQIYANEHEENPNSILELVNKLRTTNYLKKLDMGEIIANDPRTLIVDGQLMVKDDKNIYTAKSSVVNHLLKEHFNRQQKQHFTSEKNNVLALLEDKKYKDSLEQGFKSDYQSILLDKNGNIKIDSPFKHKISHHVNVNYNPSIVNDPAYEQLNSFLSHLAPNQTKQLKAMLGLIPLQGTDIMKEIRTFFILKGVSGAGKSTLAQLLKGIFDDENQSESNIISSAQNVNKALLDEHYVDLNDTKKGKIMLWFDDFQSNSKTNIITANAGTVINGAITGVTQTGAAKYGKEHAVKLPSLIVIATNSMPQITQEGTAARMFVIDSPSILRDRSIKAKGKTISISDFVNNSKVKEALFYLIMQEASKILKMNEKQRANLFDRNHSAATNLSRLSDSFLTFLEKNEITAPYDFIGMQAIKLFEVYKQQSNSYNVSYRSFTNQLEMLGLVLKRKNFGGKTYQKVICANSTQLTSAKMKIMRDDFEVYPDCVEKWDSFKQEFIGRLKTWHHGFSELKEKYDKNKDTIMFKPFDFSERG